MSFAKNSTDLDGTPRFDGNHAAPVIQILAWLFLVYIILSVAAQFATKAAMARRFVGVDFVLVAALILAIGQTATLLCPAGQPLGNIRGSLSEEAVMGAWKALYSGDILGIATLVAAKATVLVALLTLTPVVKHRIMVHVTSTVTVVWGISAMLLIAFQCPSPNRWDISNPRCMNLGIIRIYIAVLNILTDLALVAIPTLIVLPLQMTNGKRLALLTGFWSRLFVVFTSIAQIAFITRFDARNDHLHEIWRIVVCTQIVQVVSMITSTIPFLKPFLMSLESGLLSAETKAIGQGKRHLGETGCGGEEGVEHRVAASKAARALGTMKASQPRGI
ncbi:hypothetical protein CC86DRAFT_415307 [Ophiobolus disseminans]|uniref:Rhodopsin domain-containing protein n=1 Tax=Ophiobolus disseminans TaxID=1469910 RepID=A0A6A7AKK2_9PLEO|nr:hypothetical protein CC86DRAFT_415307 [Ophiobolus disseminans]